MTDTTPNQQDRDELRDIVSGWPIGSGFFGASVGTSDAREIADAILTSDWLAKHVRAKQAEVLREAADRIFSAPKSSGIAWLLHGYADGVENLPTEGAEHA